MVTMSGRLARLRTGLQPYAYWKWRMSPNITLSHCDGRADLRHGGPADRAVGEQAEVQHGGRAAALVEDEGDRGDDRARHRADGGEGEPAVLDAAGQRVAAESDGGDAERRARHVEPVAGEVLGPVGGDAEADPDPGDHGDRRVDDQQPLPAHMGQGGAADQRSEDEAGHADDDHYRHGAHAQRLVVEEAEDQGVRDRGHRRRGDAEQGAQGDQLTRGRHPHGAQAQRAEHGQPDEQDAAAAEPVGQGSGEQQTAEGQRVRAGDPLEGGGPAAEVAADGGQRDRQQGVVDHLHEEGQAERGHWNPRGAQGGICTGSGGFQHRGRHGGAPFHRTPLGYRTVFYEVR